MFLLEKINNNLKDLPSLYIITKTNTFSKKKATLGFLWSNKGRHITIYFDNDIADEYKIKSQVFYFDYLFIPTTQNHLISVIDTLDYLSNNYYLLKTSGYTNNIDICKSLLNICLFK